MKGFGILVLGTALLINQADASQLKEINAETLSNTIKCEAGSFAKSIPNVASLPGNKMKVKVSFSQNSTNSTSGGLDFKLPWIVPVGAGANLSREQLEKISVDGIPYNINPANLTNCNKKNIIREGVGIFECLSRNKPFFMDAVEGGEGSVSCSSQITATKSASLNANLVIWTISVGPSGSVSDSTTYTFLVAAPPPSKN
ncbi:hypothetical protein V5F77_01270 [Xanthobacter sp. DSM 24535]|uniref:hypothetical protein n=1 Tax=Roseixanthobacter psychrophilus TaxID=3119917 RepID=UPI003726D357